MPENIRGYIIAIVGLPVCAALFAGSLAYGALTVWYGEPLIAELGSILVYLLPSLLAVFIVLRAIRRERGTTHRAMKVFRLGMPILLVVGGIGGVVFIASVTVPHYAALGRYDRDACQRFIGDASNEAEEGCVSTAKTCRHARSDYEKRVALHPGELRPRAWPDTLPLSNSRDNAISLCLYEHQDEFRF